jgi:hypothetical protein
MVGRRSDTVTFNCKLYLHVNTYRGRRKKKRKKKRKKTSKKTSSGVSLVMCRNWSDLGDL